MGTALITLEDLWRDVHDSIPPEQKSLYINALMKAKAEPREHIHSFHRYFGKLIPAIPRFAIREFTSPGAVCLDPFCGSGTTLVEATLAGCHAWGVDLNPLAVLIAGAKTTTMPAERLWLYLEEVLQRTGSDDGRGLEQDIPFCPNMGHWFRPEVILDLTRLRRAIGRVENEPARCFLQACFSAVLRDVSNADPRHVFPGYSKRLRALDAAGRRQIKVLEKFREGARRRLEALAAYQAKRPDDAPAVVLEGDARRLPPGIPPVDLVVTNPPYLGSIRYLEAVKLEMYWLGFLPDTKAYLSLDRQVTGTERFTKDECLEWRATGISEVDGVTSLLHERGHHRMSRVVGRYFEDMSAFLFEMHRVIRPGGHFIIKISDTFVRELRVPTHAILIRLAAARGLATLAAFPDEIRNRSLLTKRNTYSKMLEHDWILVLERQR